MKKQLYLHIGYPKTATTLLQKHFYPKLEGLRYLGIRYGEGMRFSIPEQAVQALVYADRDQAATIGPEVSKKLYDSLREQPALLSLEKIVGSFFTPRRSGTDGWVWANPEAAADAIRSLFVSDLFDIKVIITLRKQTAALPSKYAQSFTSAYSKIPELETFTKFIDSVCSDPNSPVRRGYDFEQVILPFEQVLGRENLLILPYEVFAENPERFCMILTDFMGIKHNPDLVPTNRRENVRQGTGPGKQHSRATLWSQAGNGVKRFFPRFKLPRGGVFDLLRSIRSPWQADPGVIALDDESRKAIESVYADSNRRISSRYGLNLEQFGYW